jgi:hypothetical protein
MLAVSELEKGFELGSLLPAHGVDLGQVEQRNAAGLGAMRLVAPQAAVDPAANHGLGLRLGRGGREPAHQHLQAEPQNAGPMLRQAVVAGAQAYVKLA